MSRPTNRTELLTAMSQQYAALVTEIDDVDRDDRLRAGACEVWSVKDILAHLDAWHEMFLLWEGAGSAGETIAMPAPGHTWKDTPALNQEIYLRVKDDAYKTVVARLADSYLRVRFIVETYHDDDLFAKRRYVWTGSTSVGSYAVSATSNHYDWARKLVRKFKKSL